MKIAIVFQDAAYLFSVNIFRFHVNEKQEERRVWFYGLSTIVGY